MSRSTILIMLAVSASAMSPAAAGALAQPEPNQQDRTFLHQAHQANLAEIQAGEAAQDKAAGETVRKLGAKLITDHTRMDRDVRRVAEQAGVDLPARPSPEQRRRLKQVAAHSGAAFDRAWLAAQIAGHRQTLADGAAELREGSSPAVKKLATEAKPDIQMHLDMAEEANDGR
ncbi:DUF4142 domain-containing protein [Nonomuraea sp. NPDC050786]|uniref:DUF4142 domain-containing protein n=1 Tax=Nonomuraea sp. NPDC050786 TaxID=3154840 RepID=UPI00340672A4